MANLPGMPLVELPLHVAGSGTMPDFLAQAATDYGPIFRSIVPAGREAGREVIFMVGPEANRFVLHTHREHFSHDQGWTPVIGANVGQGLLMMDDPIHPYHRKLWNPAFSAAPIAAYAPEIYACIVDRTQGWVERGEVDLYEEARRITFDIAAMVLGGLPGGADLDRVRALFYELFHSYDRRRESAQAFRIRKGRVRGELDALLLAMIAARRKIPPEAQPRDVLGVLAHARDARGKPLAARQILAHINILLVAGHETTTTLGAWALYLLATLPDHRERIRAEIAGLTPEEGAMLPAAALQGLPNLDYFVREVGRLYTPVLNLPRGVIAPFSFHSHVVTAGMPVRLAISAGHRLPGVFADPAVFDPQRFAPPREEDKRRPYSLVIFGAGPRICIGVNVAQIEIKALIAHVLRRFDLEPVPGQRPIHAGFWVARIPFGIRVRVRAAETSGFAFRTAAP